MRIAVLCNDTRGGVQPYVALACGLRDAGHDVRAVAPTDLALMFDRRGITTAPLAGSIEAVLREGAAALAGGPRAGMRFAAREMAPRIDAWTCTTLAACDDVDVVTGGVGGMVVGLAVAEKLGRPFVEAHLQPIGAPTGAYPGVLLAGLPGWLGRPGRYLSHYLSDQGVWMPFRRAMAQARESVLGLSGRPPARRGPVLYGFSRHVVPLPTGRERPRHATGYWTLPAGPDWTPPPALAAFLSRPGPVVSIGFGSMAGGDPDATTALAENAACRAGVRAVLLAGSGGLAATPETDGVFVADAVPHDWLFPRVDAVVHHGGAGTTGAAIQAGVPAVVVPFTVDQPFWASRVAALGVGPAPLPYGQLSAARLADALRQATTDKPMRDRARTLGAAVRAEDGVAAAVAHFPPA